MLDRALTALANKHRRRLLAALLERDPRNEVPVPEVVHAGEKELENLKNEMYHAHLPMLADAGFVRWDRETYTVEIGPQFEEIRPLLELLCEHADDLPGEVI